MAGIMTINAVIQKTARGCYDFRLGGSLKGEYQSPSLSKGGFMQIEALETRQLMAATEATAYLDDGVLRVIGTDESESLAVHYVVKNLLQTTPNASADVTATYVVTTNLGAGESSVTGVKQIGAVPADQVRRINIFGLGGKDNIAGPVAVQGTELINAGDQPVLAPPIPMYIEGGSGNDRIIGGSGNDTIYGGRGDDSIGDFFGSNLLTGGSGHDTFAATEGRRQQTVVGNDGAPHTRYVAVYTGAPDTISGETGDDLISYNGDDVLKGFDGQAIPQPAGGWPPIIYY
ncbi:MAG: calcium-binding protein [Tepidisphaeraceae bacterium]